MPFRKIRAFRRPSGVFRRRRVLGFMSGIEHDLACDVFALEPRPTDANDPR